MSKNRQKNRDRFREIWRRQISGLSDDELLAMARGRGLEPAQRTVLNDVLSNRGLLSVDVESLSGAPSSTQAVETGKRAADAEEPRNLKAVVETWWTTLLVGFVIGVLLPSIPLSFEETPKISEGPPVETLGDLIGIFATIIGIIVIPLSMIAMPIIFNKDMRGRAILTGVHRIALWVVYGVVVLGAAYLTKLFLDW